MTKIGQTISSILIDDTTHDIDAVTVNGKTIPDISTNISTDESSDAKTVSPKAVKTYVDDLVANATHYKGDFTASGDGSITGTEKTLKSVSEKVGDMYVVSTAGTYAGVSLQVGDSIIFKKAVSAGTSPTANSITFVQGTVGVSDSDSTLNWGTKSTVGTVEGVELHVTLPQKPSYDLDDVSDGTTRKLVPFNSPAFTGTPTAPTASVGTNTTQIATTEFVNSAINNASVISGTGVSAIVTLTESEYAALVTKDSTTLYIVMP